jgi:hypothetical protein
MDNETPTEKVNRIYNKYQKYFTGSFHSFLWAILVTQIRPNNGDTVLVYMAAGPHNIGLADRDQNGYSPLNFSFKQNEVMSWSWKEHHELAQRIVEELNRELFDVDPDEAALVVITTMRSN